MSLLIVPIEPGKVMYRPNAVTSGGPPVPVFALIVAPTEDLNRKPRAWAVDGWGDWRPLGVQADQGRLA